MTPEQLRVVGELRTLAANGRARDMRLALHIGLRELARTIEASPSTVSRWETGATVPRAATALKWAHVLGLYQPDNAAASVMLRVNRAA
jgi:transcriptional regulator with XRE-family HTH domain